MTMPDERTRALLWAGCFLVDIARDETLPSPSDEGPQRSRDISPLWKTSPGWQSPFATLFSAFSWPHRNKHFPNRVIGTLNR